VFRQGARGEAVRAPLAARDAVRGAKNQAETIAVYLLKSVPGRKSGLAAFSAPCPEGVRTAKGPPDLSSGKPDKPLSPSKSSHDIHIALRCSPRWHEKSLPSIRFHLTKLRSEFSYAAIFTFEDAGASLSPFLLATTTTPISQSACLAATSKGVCGTSPITAASLSETSRCGACQR